MRATGLHERCEVVIEREDGELADILAAMRVMVRYRGEPSEVWQAVCRVLIEPPHPPHAETTIETPQ